jgi:hypothetical protein
MSLLGLFRACYPSLFVNQFKSPLTPLFQRGDIVGREFVYAESALHFVMEMALMGD